MISDSKLVSVLTSAAFGTTRTGDAKALTWTYESIAESAEDNGVDQEMLGSAKHVFGRLRSLGFTDAHTDGKRCIAATLQTYVRFILPCVKELAARSFN